MLAKRWGGRLVDMLLVGTYRHALENPPFSSVLKTGGGGGQDGNQVRPLLRHVSNRNSCLFFLPLFLFLFWGELTR